MKLAGIAGTGRGKLGTMVFSASAGEQVVRQYQPNVSNPNTTAQVTQRAKFKLMSQVAAAVSGEIIIPRTGLKSSRNKFVQKNFGLVNAIGDTASLNYEGLQFTEGNVALPAVSASRAVGGISVALSAAANVSRVCYLVYRKTSQGALQFSSSTIVETAGDGNTFPATLPAVNSEVVIYAYGMRDLSAAASANYGNYGVSDGTSLATLVLGRQLSTSDYQFTRTVGTTLANNQQIVGVSFEDYFSPEVLYESTNNVIVPEMSGMQGTALINLMFNNSITLGSSNRLVFVNNNNVETGLIGVTFDHDDNTPERIGISTPVEDNKENWNIQIFGNKGHFEMRIDDETYILPVVV